MLVQRITVCVMGVLVCVQQHNRPTILAKVHIYREVSYVLYCILKVVLILGLLFLIADDLPNSLVATGNFYSSKVY